MKCYVIGIGGTGHRSIEALIHLTAAGLLMCDEINLMFVDSDSRNGNFVEKTKATLQSFIEAKQYTSNKEGFFNTVLRPNIDIDKALWSPVEGASAAGRLDDRNKTLNNLFDYTMMDDLEKDLFHFLFTKKERETPLVEGFYGHPSIGATMIAHSMNPEEEPWKTFIENLNADVINDDVRLFFVGSVFGGTGAAGIPMISRLIKESVNHSNLKIGACLLLPYFKFDGSKLNKMNGGLKPDSGCFLAKSKAALYFYDNQEYSQKYFDRSYVIGDTYEDFTEVEAALGNLQQNNKAHIVEFYSALAIADFMNSANVKSDEKVFLINRLKENGSRNADVPGKYLYNWEVADDVLGAGISVKDKLAQMMRFSFAFTSRFFPILSEIEGNDLNNNDYKSITWYKYYFLDKETDIRKKEHPEYYDHLVKMNEYCIRFIKWMNELHRKSREMESLGYDPSVMMINFSGVIDSMNPDKLADAIHKTEINGFSNLVYDESREENSFNRIYWEMCKKPKGKEHNYTPAEQFLVQLYNNSKLY